MSHSSSDSESISMTEGRWCSVTGWGDKYVVSNNGVVKCKEVIINQNDKRYNSKARILPTQLWKGYKTVTLYFEFKRKNAFIHRLVAKAFIPNPLNLPQVNHKNGIPTDNNWANLEWVTPQQNIQHAFDNKLIIAAVGKGHFNFQGSINAYKNGELICTLSGTKEIKQSGFCPTGVYGYLKNPLTPKGKTRTVKGFTFERIPKTISA